MKKILNGVFLVAIASITMLSCKKEEDKVTFTPNGANPVLSGVANSNASTIELSKANESKPALTLMWTNPEYKLSNGVSSQNVKYTVQVDTVGGDFSDPAVITTTESDLKITLTQQQVNAALLDFGLTYGKAYDLQMRVIASIGNFTPTELVSNVVTFESTPYLDVKVPLPATGELWATGDAFASNWKNPLPSPWDASQKFTKVSETLYELTVDFIGGGGYKIIQEQGVWSSQYHALDGTAVTSGSFEKKDADPQFPGQPVAGTYKISVDFITGIYTVTKL